MAIVAGFDMHRAQVTFDALDTESGEVIRGRLEATLSWAGFRGDRVLSFPIFICVSSRRSRRVLVP
jgi:hypothetical protein